MNNDGEINEFQKFRDETTLKISTLIRRQDNLEETYKKNLNNIQSHYDEYIKSLTLKIKEIESTIIKDKLKIESIETLVEYKRSSEQDISTINFKLNSFSKEFKEICYKYDKIYLENLFIPGIIGENNCKFRNMKDFVEFEFNNINFLMSEKERSMVEIKYCRDRIDNFPKFVNSQVTDCEKGLKVFIKALIESNQISMKSEFDLFSERIHECKVENNKYVLELIKTSKELKTEKEDFNNLKIETLNKLENISNSYLIDFKNIQEITEKLESEFREFKDKNKELNEKQFGSRLKKIGSFHEFNRDKTRKNTFIERKNLKENSDLEIIEKPSEISFNSKRPLRKKFGTVVNFKSSDVLDSNPFINKKTEEIIFEQQDEYANSPVKSSKSKTTQVEINEKSNEKEIEEIKIFDFQEKEILNTNDDRNKPNLISSKPFKNENNEGVKESALKKRNLYNQKQTFSKLNDKPSSRVRSDLKFMNSQESAISNEIKNKININESNKSIEKIPIPKIFTEKREKSLNDDDSIDKNEDIPPIIHPKKNKSHEIKAEPKNNLKISFLEMKINEIESAQKQILDTLSKQNTSKIKEILTNSLKNESIAISPTKNLKSKSTFNLYSGNILSINVLNPTEVFRNVNLEYEKKNKVIKNQAFSEIPITKVKSLMKSPSQTKTRNNTFLDKNKVEIMKDTKLKNKSMITLKKKP